MFSVAVKDHIMIAHSFQGEIFGPAQKLHGATYIITAEFKVAQLDKDGLVIDIGQAIAILKEVLEPLNYQNLDTLEQFKGINTTTEYMGYYIHQQISKKVGSFFKGSLKITLEESHIAWGSYEAEV
ncbi:6-carboxytetrahydropterin synthase [Brasilonema sp. UFV-L1]|uniref:6-pyruvoyl trahydropterin synthase family protein n=1 Tax=Brasilonema sp. UFV-L1 TaxID=2234130 RepID=UPI00145D2FA2|nr:6-carboxytetrahydropterin synthase [Brasilonema sp. UFV-L1]NMG06240.1 6-carboxytetrahydropterin synthase [Brasilonema sp. UFV-L1]